MIRSLLDGSVSTAGSLQEMEFNRLEGSINSSQSLLDLASGYPATGWPLWIQPFDYMSAAPDLAPYGTEALRSAFHDDPWLALKGSFDPTSELTITGSASEAISCATLATAVPGTAAIMLTPHFPVYEAIARVAHLRPLFIPIDVGATLDVGAIERECNAGASVLFLNTPHNPSGWQASESELRAVAEVCAHTGTMLVCDEVFATFADPAYHYPAAKLAPHLESLIVVGDSGKRFDFGGLRVGVVAANRRLTARIRTVQQLFTYRISTAVQHLVADALTGAMRHGHYEEISMQAKQNAAILNGALATTSWFQGSVPVAGSFLLAHAPKAGDHHRAVEDLWSRGVAGVGPKAFNQGRADSAAGHFVRLSLMRPSELVSEAAARIVNARPVR